MVKSIVLMGYMGCGKSAVGKRLAALKSLSFIDLDEYIESQEKNTISQIFEQDGELYFRKKERFYLEKLLSKDPQAVISLGGGTPCYFDNIDFVVQKKDILSLYLKTSPKTLAERLFDQKDHRPMIAHLQTLQELEEFIGKHLFERVPFYIKAEHHITTDYHLVDELVNRIEKLLA
jgi:shikimate kinase